MRWDYKVQHFGSTKHLITFCSVHAPNAKHVFLREVFEKKNSYLSKIKDHQTCTLCLCFVLLIDLCVIFWQLAAILPLALVHTLGNLFTNMSLGKVAVSFTHTIKAMEPFFSVVLSAMFLGEVRILYSIFFNLWCCLPLS